MTRSTSGTNNGPIYTDQGGNLDEPILMCNGCKHLGVHDSHYFYCAGQHAANQNPNESVPYPWRGAGAILHRGPYPTEGCPYQPAPAIIANAIIKRVRDTVGYAESDQKEELIKGALIAASIMSADYSVRYADHAKMQASLNSQLAEVKNDMETVITIFRKYDPQQ